MSAIAVRLKNRRRKRTFVVGVLDGFSFDLFLTLKESVISRDTLISWKYDVNIRITRKSVGPLVFPPLEL